MGSMLMHYCILKINPQKITRATMIIRLISAMFVALPTLNLDTSPCNNMAFQPERPVITTMALSCPMWLSWFYKPEFN